MHAATDVPLSPSPKRKERERFPVFADRLPGFPQPDERIPGDYKKRRSAHMTKDEQVPVEEGQELVARQTRTCCYKDKNSDSKENNCIPHLSSQADLHMETYKTEHQLKNTQLKNRRWNHPQPLLQHPARDEDWILCHGCALF